MDIQIYNLALDHAGPPFAEGQRRFFRHEVKTWGVRGDAVTEIARQLCGEVRRWPAGAHEEQMERIWKHGTPECGAVVCHVMRRLARTFSGREFLLFEQCQDRHAHNSAHTDGIASWLMAACIANDASLLERVWGWTNSPNRWNRRTAVVSLLQELKRGQQKKFVLRITKKPLQDRDDMVEKGLGWLLKEAYPQRPAEVVAFLLREPNAASHLTLHYAAEKMTPEHRRKVLA